MDKFAVLSFGDIGDSIAQLVYMERNVNKPAVRVEKKMLLDGMFYEFMKTDNTSGFQKSLGSLFQNKELEGRFFYVTVPDSLVTYKCFSRNKIHAPNLKKQEDVDNFMRLCLKENPERKEPKDYFGAIMGMGSDDSNNYYTCAYIPSTIIRMIEKTFAFYKVPIFAVEPNFYGMLRILRIKYPEGPIIFDHGGNYFWAEKENIFSLRSTEEEALINYQILMALRQKAFQTDITWEEVNKCTLKDGQNLPLWIMGDNGYKDYYELCALGSGLRGVKVPGDKKEEAHGLEKFRKLFKRKKSEL